MYLEQYDYTKVGLSSEKNHIYVVLLTYDIDKDTTKGDIFSKG